MADDTKIQIPLPMAMKKLLSKFENTFDAQQPFAGKVFNVGRHCVTVEDVIAEGGWSLFVSINASLITWVRHDRA